MKILVTGVKGQLGYDVVNELNKRGHDAIGIDLEDLDITIQSDVESKITAWNPDAVIHCAAYTAVDAAEENQELCMMVNASATEYIAEVCKKLDIKLIYISTDYVFDGEGERPWEPDDACHPINIYGDSKYHGELAVSSLLSKYFIVRISWVFGTNGNNFIKTMLKLAETRDELSVVDDQVGSPTYTYDLSILLADMVESEAYGIYHASNEGYCTWYDFATKIFEVAGESITVHPVTSDQFPVKAKRPHNSRMDKSKLDAKGFKRLPSWQDAVERYVESLV